MPLVLYPPPSITREIALRALDAAGRPWRATCTSASLAGLHAAMAAGLGIAAHSHRLLPPGLVVLDPGHGLPAHALPALGTVDFVILGGGAADGAAAALAEAVLAGMGAAHPERPG